MSRPLPYPVAWPDAEEERAAPWPWAALMLAPDVHLCQNILLGRPVLVREPLPVPCETAASAVGRCPIPAHTSVLVRM